MVDIQAYALNDELFVSTTGQSGSMIETKSILKPFYTNIEKNVLEIGFCQTMSFRWPSDGSICINRG